MIAHAAVVVRYRSIDGKSSFGRMNSRHLLLWSPLTPLHTQVLRTTTLDGYILSVIRIPNRSTGRVVMFQHGLLDSPAAWVSNGHIFSLAYRAYQCGYDVFLGTYRGTGDDDVFGSGGSGGSESQRRRHVTLSRSDSEYWNFSVDDHGLDVFATMQRIQEVKRHELAARTAGQRAGGAIAGLTSLCMRFRCRHTSGLDKEPLERCIRIPVSPVRPCWIVCLNH